MPDCVNCAPLDEGETVCPALAYQKASVCVPVKVTPYAVTGDVVTVCCGDATVDTVTTNCAGKKNGSCTFLIHQTLCIEIPVEFGATAEAGDTYVECLEAGAGECEDCDEEAAE